MHMESCTGENQTTPAVWAFMVSEKNPGTPLEIKVLPEMLKLHYRSRCKHCLVWMQMTKSGPNECIALGPEDGHPRQLKN